jgi:hypothetical protein
MSFQTAAPEDMATATDIANLIGIFGHVGREVRVDGRRRRKDPHRNYGKWGNLGCEKRSRERSRWERGLCSEKGSLISGRPGFGLAW